MAHPLTKEDEEHHTCMTKIKVSRSADKATLRCKTRGQPVVYKRIVVPRKSSLLAASPLGKKRSKLMAKIRQDVSGNSADDSIKQHSELKRSSKTLKEKLVQAASMERPAISNKESSASRTKLRAGINIAKHRRFLKSIRVIVPGEHTERVFQDSVVCGDIKVNKSMASQDKAGSSSWLH